MVLCPFYFFQWNEIVPFTLCYETLSKTLNLSLNFDNELEVRPVWTTSFKQNTGQKKKKSRTLINHPAKTSRGKFAEWNGTWLSRSSYGVYMAVTGSVWLLWGACGNNIAPRNGHKPCYYYIRHRNCHEVAMPHSISQKLSYMALMGQLYIIHEDKTTALIALLQS